MVLPVMRLGTLLLKTLSKPIANRLKKDAGLHPKFRHFIIGMAQANHRYTTQMLRRIYGQATDVAIRPLNEERAVQAAADLLGELFVFTVAGAAVIFEVQRRSKSEAQREEFDKQKLQALYQRDEDLTREVQSLRDRGQEVKQQLVHKQQEMEQLIHKQEEMEQLLKGRGFRGVINLYPRHPKNFIVFHRDITIHEVVFKMKA